MDQLVGGEWLEKELGTPAGRRLGGAVRRSRPCDHLLRRRDRRRLRRLRPPPPRLRNVAIYDGSLSAPDPGPPVPAAFGLAEDDEPAGVGRRTHAPPHDGPRPAPAAGIPALARLSLLDRIRPG